VRLSELQAALARHSAVLRFAPDGEHLECEALQPLTPEIVKGLQEHRAALLRQVQEALQNDMDQQQTSLETAPTHARWPALDLLARAQQPGHCGCCARWAAYPSPADHMGVCSAGRAAHGWLDGAAHASVETQVGLRCQVYEGTGWEVRPEKSSVKSTRQHLPPTP